MEGEGQSKGTLKMLLIHVVCVRKTDSTIAQVHPVRFILQYFYGLFILCTPNKRARKLADPVIREFFQFGALFR